MTSPWGSSCLLTSLILLCSGGQLISGSNVDTQAEAVKGLINRLIPEHVDSFNIVINSSLFHDDQQTIQDPIFLNENPKPLDCFKVSSLSEGVIEVTATSGVAAAGGFQHYLKYTCGCHISWSGDQLNLPEILPNITEPIEICSPYRYRYYQNVCTTSYSFVWWDWSRWEREVDWMAMNGINLPLAFTGMEYVWKKVYLGLGFTEAEMEDHFAGPAFLAWQRMGNMHGWGGPLPDYWMLNQYNLQKKILKRMRAFGMTAILPGFAGHVPSSILRVFPNANVTKLGSWGKFNSTYCCTDLLEPSDPLFKQIGKKFISEIIKNFGTDHFYNMDTFNEMRPRSNDTVYLMNTSRSVFNAMNAADSKGIWVVQGWLFVDDRDFWKPQQIQSYLHGVPLGSMIVLDLQAEVQPMYNETQSFYGQPFVWCMLHNFGGNQRLYGTLQRITEGPVLAAHYPNSTMIGIGVTPEGINQNDIVYEMMNEMGWRDIPIDNISTWVGNFTRRRYGNSSADSDKGWEILIETVYSCWNNHSDHNHGLPVIRPGLHIKPNMWYNVSDILSAWKLFITAAPIMGDSSTFRYDLISVTMQALQDHSFVIYTEILEAYRKSDITSLRLNGAFLLEIISGMERLLLTDDRCLLGRWINDAKQQANENDKELFGFNARNQVTLWGPGPRSILDYANKMWASLMKSYYHPRWELFISTLIECTEKQTQVNSTWLDEQIYHLDYKWNYDNKTEYPSVPSGNTVQVATELYEEILKHCVIPTVF